MAAKSANAPGTRHNFVFGDDGRFHVAGDYGKVLSVGADGYLRVRAAGADSPESLNGVFEYDGTYLIHQEDGKYLTTGISAFTPFVDKYIRRNQRSEWQLLRPLAKLAIPPTVNRHTFRKRLAGSESLLYAFYKDPDSALPRSATRFVTNVPGNAHSGNFLDYVSRYVTSDLHDAAGWLRANNAAWLFKDGFYAVSEGHGQLEVRRLDGAPVWRADGLDENLIEPTFTRLDPLSSNFQIPDETWRRVQQREQRMQTAIHQLNQLRLAM